MKLVFGECFMYSTLFMAHKLSRVWSLKVKVYFGKGIRVITLYVYRVPQNYGRTEIASEGH